MMLFTKVKLQRLMLAPIARTNYGHIVVPRVRALVNASCAPAMPPLGLSVFPRLVNPVSFMSNSIGEQRENNPED